jgi:rubrerythrin
MTPPEQATANLTGIGAAPDRAARMVEATQEFLPTSEGSSFDLGAVRARYRNEAESAPDGPPQPAALSLLMDKLGERLAFERVGSRLYEALLAKYDVDGSFEGGPSRAELAGILSEERVHFRLLAEAIEALGGDPTELTPSANVQLTASQGVGQVLANPATSLVQCLEAMAMAELTDNECWETLGSLAQLADDEGLASMCEQALATEGEHLEKLRTWLAAARGALEVEGEGDVEETEDGGAAKSRRSSRKQANSRKERR